MMIPLLSSFSSTSRKSKSNLTFKACSPVLMITKFQDGSTTICNQTGNFSSLFFAESSPTAAYQIPSQSLSLNYFDLLN